MSYDPSHRRPPRQDRWPNATPREPWPAYTGADAYRETAGGYQGGEADYWNGNGYDRGYGYGQVAPG